jgi:uncharacterized protein (DUF433 family)
MHEDRLLKRITVDPAIYGGKPIIRGRRLAVEHVLSMLAAGDDIATLLEGYPWLEREDVLACLAYAHRLVGLSARQQGAYCVALLDGYSDELARGAILTATAQRVRIRPGDPPDTQSTSGEPQRTR